MERGGEEVAARKQKQVQQQGGACKQNNPTNANETGGVPGIAGNREYHRSRAIRTRGVWTESVRRAIIAGNKQQAAAPADNKTHPDSASSYHAADSPLQSAEQGTQAAKRTTAGKQRQRLGSALRRSSIPFH